MVRMVKPEMDRHISKDFEKPEKRLGHSWIIDGNKKWLTKSLNVDFFSSLAIATCELCLMYDHNTIDITFLLVDKWWIQ